MKKNSSLKVSRRHFIATAGAAMVMPMIMPSSVFGQNAPSKRINLGVIGMGWQGPSNTQNFLSLDACRVIAACDIDANHLQGALDMVNGAYQNKDCKGYHDFRELLARDDIDAVVIATPDHWHALVATEAARRKKDIYCEKPLAKTIAEQQAMVRAAEANKVIWQMGSWQRSVPTFHKAAEIVRSGLIGTVTRVEVGLPAGHADFSGEGKAALEKLAGLPDKVTDLTQVTPGTPAWNLLATPPPAELDYNTWIGPSKMEPYIAARSHKNWRWNYNTGGGQLMDWIGHHCDIAHWGMGFDHSGPSEIEAHGEFPAANAVWNTSPKYRIEAQYKKEVTGYAGDVAFTIAGGYAEIRGGVKWIGTDGWVWVDRGGFDASNQDWKKGKTLPEELRKEKLYVSGNHWQNFLDCIKSRQPTITPVEVGHHSTIPGHLGYISMVTGRKINWDVAAEQIIGDPEASRLLARDYRAPWKIA